MGEMIRVPFHHIVGLIHHILTGVETGVGEYHPVHHGGLAAVRGGGEHGTHGQGVEEHLATGSEHSPGYTRVSHHCSRSYQYCGPEAAALEDTGSGGSLYHAQYPA